ncbi:MAG TPA: type II toxin-antitoxin system HicB family antitoxin [Candidatus Eremiobacteraceae bacterium]|nr:type II toxin-antitoxin system HicB family antitoxin [Candidatus Eremiobacteraceae bacterium]
MNAGYSEELKRNSDGTYFARIVEFPGCMTEGDTKAEALANLKDAMRGWIEIGLEDGDPIPPPLGDPQFSGKFVVRVPRPVHRELSRRAELEGVSLNQFVLAALAKEIGRKSP